MTWRPGLLALLLGLTLAGCGLGGQAYARNFYNDSLSAGGPQVKAVLNLDMVSYCTKALPAICRIKTRAQSIDSKGYQADLVIANTFKDAIATYSIKDLTPLVTDDNDEAGDPWRFWQRDIPAAWAIEDDKGDWNANYHRPGDNLDKVNLAYFTAMVKATVATAAHLAVPANSSSSAP